MKKLKILYLESNPFDINLMNETLEKSSLDYELVIVKNKDEFESVLLSSSFDIIIAAYAIPHYDGVTALKYAKAQKSETPFILISGVIGEDKAVELFQYGVEDFISKRNLKRVIPVIKRSISKSHEHSMRKKAEKALRLNELHFKKYVENIESVLYEASPLIDKITYVSPAYEKIWQKSRESLYQNPMDWLNSVVPKDKERVKNLFLKLKNKDTPKVVCQYDILLPDGSIKTIFDQAFQLIDDNGVIIGRIGIASDITEFLLLQKDMEIENEFQKVFDTDKDIKSGLSDILTSLCQSFKFDLGQIWLVGSNNSLNYFCSWASESVNISTLSQIDRITEYKRGVGLLGWVWDCNKPLWLYDITEYTKFRHLSDIASKGFTNGLILPISFADQVYCIMEFYSRQNRDHNPLFHNIIANLHRRINAFVFNKTLEERFVHISESDFLTGLLNLNSFQNAVENIISFEPALFSIIIIDIDQFNEIINTYGLKISNYILLNISEKLKLFTFPGIKVARLGDCRFGVSAIAHNTTEVFSFLKQIHEIFESPIFTEHHEIFLTASIGASLYPENGLIFSDLLKNANIAVKSIKEAGGDNSQIFSTAMEPEFSDYRQLTLMHHAFKNKEFAIYFQPLVDAKTRMIVGAEALIRWINSKNEVIPPNFFLPFAEKSGFSLTLGDWVIQEACKVIKDWESKGINVPISINVSPRHLNSKELINSIELSMRENNINHDMIHIEITEKALVQETMNAIDSLIYLNKNNIKLSIDDFGTGYSSFAYLKRFQIDSLKIDKSFIDGVPKNITDVSIVSGIIGMAHELGLNIVAEGVETKAQYEFLKQKGCDKIQGYYFFKALPKEEFEKVFFGGRDTSNIHNMDD